jgi:hypothetical protein
MGKAMSASAPWPRKLPTNGASGKRSRVWMATCGPITAARSPPTMTKEMARGRKAKLAPSVAAKR